MTKALRRATMALGLTAALGATSAAHAQSPCSSSASSGIVTFTCSLLGQAGTVPFTAPVRDGTFLKSLGVNVQLNYTGDAWDNTVGATNPATKAPWGTAEAKIKSELAYLGFSILRQGGLKGRDGVGDTVPKLKDFCSQLGYTVDVVQEINNGAVDISDDIADLNEFPAGCISSYENANEANTHSYSIVANGVTYQSLNHLGWFWLDNQASMAALRSNDATAIIPDIGASTASTPTTPMISSNADVINYHVYGNEAQQLSPNLMTAIASLQQQGGGKPIAITETGATSLGLTAGSYGDAGSPRAQAVVDVNAVLTAFFAGGPRTKTFLYELMNDNNDTSKQSNFGLFNVDGSPKLSATALHNLVTILADPGSTALTFNTVDAPFVISNLPAGASAMLLQKSGGTYELILWNGTATVYTTADVTPPAVNVGVQLSGVYTTVNVYDPITGTSPTASSPGVSSVTVALSADPVIVEIIK